MEWIWKIRNAVGVQNIRYAIYVVLVAIFFNLITIAAEAKADEFGMGDMSEELSGGGVGVPDYHEDAGSYDNSVHNYENTPHSYENTEHSLENSRFSHEPHIIRDNTGKAVGYWKQREDGGINIYGYDGEGRTGFIPAPRK